MSEDREEMARQENRGCWSGAFRRLGWSSFDASDLSAAWGEVCTHLGGGQEGQEGEEREDQPLIYSRIMEISLFIYQLVSCNPFLQSKCTNNIDAKWKRTNVFSGKFT